MSSSRTIAEQFSWFRLPFAIDLPRFNHLNLLVVSELSVRIRDNQRHFLAWTAELGIIRIHLCRTEFAFLRRRVFHVFHFLNDPALKFVQQRRIDCAADLVAHHLLNKSCLLRFQFTLWADTVHYASFLVKTLRHKWHHRLTAFSAVVPISRLQGVMRLFRLRWREAFLRESIVCKYLDICHVVKHFDCGSLYFRQIQLFCC